MGGGVKKNEGRGGHSLGTEESTVYQQRDAYKCSFLPTQPLLHFTWQLDSSSSILMSWHCCLWPPPQKRLSCFQPRHDTVFLGFLWDPHPRWWVVDGGWLVVLRSFPSKVSTVLRYFKSIPWVWVRHLPSLSFSLKKNFFFQILCFEILF